MQLVDDLLHSGSFRDGLLAGATAMLVMLLVVVAVRTGVRPRLRTTVPGAGIAIAVAGVVALDGGNASLPVDDRLVAGLVALALGPCLAALLRPSPTLSVVSTVPGAYLVALATTDHNDVGWVPALVFVTIVLGGALVADFDEVNADAGLGLVLLPISALGMYTALPDTEEVALVVGAAVPMIVLGAPIALARLGRPGVATCVGLLAWVAAVDGRARPGSVVGAIACLGLMLVEPFVRRLLPGAARPTRALSVRGILVIALHTGLVAGTSRIAGLRASGAAAGAISGLALALAAIFLAIVLFPWGQEAEPQDPEPLPPGDPPPGATQPRRPPGPSAARARPR